jgi:hypothetical protein
MALDQYRGRAADHEAFLGRGGGLAYLHGALDGRAGAPGFALTWQRFLRRHDRPVLHDRDRSHAIPAGSYLAAGVFLAVLFRESPVGIKGEVAGLSDKGLALLQKAAWQECRPGTRRGGR